MLNKELKSQSMHAVEDRPYLLEGGQLVQVDHEVVPLHQRECFGQPVRRLGHANVLYHTKWALKRMTNLSCMSAALLTNGISPSKQHAISLTTPRVQSQFLKLVSGALQL